jgi:nucleoid-associated protein YgaU
MSQAQLDQLKTKYQSVLNLISQLGVQLQNLHVQDNKLVIRAQAQTKSISNKIWDQIKLVNRDYVQDLMAEITYATDDLATAAAAAASGGAQTRSYTVKAGDTLSKIAKAHYGDANQYSKIFEANRDKLKDPDKIFPGQVLTIP